MTDLSIARLKHLREFLLDLIANIDLKKYPSNKTIEQAELARQALVKRLDKINAQLGDECED